MDDFIKQIEEELEQKNIMNKDIRTILDKYYTRLKIKGLEDLYGKTFYIPSYQRGYRWTEDNVQKLLNDLENFGENEKNHDIDYCLQPLIVKRCVDNKNNEMYELIDGQQRLTTLKFILDELFNENNENNENEYFLKYEIENNKIDQHYMENAKQTIKDNFEGKKNKSKKEIILNVINENRIKFLWYEIGEEDNENEIFSRINDGKILLSNAENSKALLLKLESDKKSDEFEFKQKTDAMKWDEIENLLEDDEFWYFLTNKKLQYKFEKTRIDLIFDIYEKILGENNIFDYIENEIYKNTDNKEKIWNDLKSIYECLREWYDDSELYHLVGYYIYISNEKYIDTVANLVNRYVPHLKDDNNEQEKIKNKEKFKEELYEKIRKDLKNEYIGYINNLKGTNKKNKNSSIGDFEKMVDKIEYCDEGRNLINKILFVFNCLSMIDTEERISFNKFKEEKWNIEHIYPVHDDIETLNDEKKKGELVESLEHFLKNINKIDEKNKDRKEKDKQDEELNDNIEKIKTKLENFKQNYNDESFSDIAMAIDKIVSNSTTLMDDITKNSIGNLVLLNETINKGYRNDLFIQKRKVIIDKVLKNENDENRKQGNIKKKAMDSRKFYILPCTERAFLKFYSPDILQSNRWDENDVKNYKNAIEATLKTINEKSGKNDNKTDKNAERAEKNEK